MIEITSTRLLALAVFLLPLAFIFGIAWGLKIWSEKAWRDYKKTRFYYYYHKPYKAEKRIRQTRIGDLIRRIFKSL